MKKALFIFVMSFTTILFSISCAAQTTVTQTVERTVSQVTTVTKVMTITQPQATITVTAPPVTLPPKTVIATSGGTTTSTQGAIISTTTSTNIPAGGNSINQPVTVGSTARWMVTAVQNMGSVIPASQSRYGSMGQAKTTTGNLLLEMIYLFFPLLVVPSEADMVDIAFS